MDSSGKQSVGARESVGAHDYGFEKYGAEGLLASSVSLGWSALSAELRAHGRGVIAYEMTQPEAEICVAISSSNSFVTRSTGGVVDRSIADRGTIWLSPPGPKEGFVDISAPVPQILHIYLPTQHFSAESLGVDIDHVAHASLCY